MPPSGFQITARGIKRAEKVEKSLGKPMKTVRVRKSKAEKTVVSTPVVEKIHPELKAHARKYVRSIELSDAYKHFKKGIRSTNLTSEVYCSARWNPRQRHLHEI